MTASNFCKDCTHATKDCFGLRECEKTRRHYTDGVTGEQWSCASSCSYARTGSNTCANFEPTLTLWERVKEVFQ